MTTDTIAARARQMRQATEQAQRPDGSWFWRLRDGSPKWMQDVAREAHDHASMLPDDWRYAFMVEALDALEEAEGDLDDARERMPEPSVYTAERCAWLASHAMRAGYVDEAVEDMGGWQGGIIDQDAIALGMQREAEEVLTQLAAALEEIGEEDEAD